MDGDGDARFEKRHSQDETLNRRRGRSAETERDAAHQDGQARTEAKHQAAMDGSWGGCCSRTRLKYRPV